MKMYARIVPIFVAFFCLINTASAQLIINEVVSDNNESLDVNGLSPDWIELANYGDINIDLEGYYLSDDKDQLDKFRITNASIGANKFLLLICDGDDLIDNFIHTNFKVSASGESLYLSNPSLELIWTVDVPQLEEDISYTWDGTDYITSTPTPLGANNSNGLIPIDPPLFSQTSQTQQSEFELSISVSPTQHIEYYINDLDHSIASTSDEVNIQIDTTSIICAKALEKGFISSSLICHTFLIGEDHNLPVLSIIAEGKALFDPQKGMFELGSNADPAWPHLGANFWEDDSEEVFFNYIESNGASLFHGHCDLQMHGGRESRTAPQKTFRLKAKSKVKDK